MHTRIPPVLLGLLALLLSLRPAAAQQPKIPPVAQVMEAKDAATVRQVLAEHPELLRDDPSGKAPSGRMLLCTFIVLGRDLSCIEALVDAGIPVRPDPQNATAMPIIFAAVMRGDARVMEFVISRGGDVNEYYNGCTPLMMAVGMSGRDDEHMAEITRVLLQHGADPNLSARPSEEDEHAARKMTARDMARQLGGPKTKRALGL